VENIGMSLGLLARQPLTWDSEAAAYILQVEAADGQSLELGIARAINTFVIDCKVRGIWEAIKSCCLLSGARTLSGALRPLKGNAPTNSNFINSDYNRETGLNNTSGGNKSLNLNRSPINDPTNSHHCAIYYTRLPPVSGGGSFLINNININGGGGTTINYGGAFIPTVYSQCNSGGAGANTAHGRSNTSNLGFTGVSRSNSNNYVFRFEKTNTIITRPSITLSTNNYRLLSNELGTVSANGRINFYSVGENLDLRLLEQCIENYNNSLSRILTSSYIISDTDAATYIALVEAADKTSLSYTYRKGVNDFIAGCKSDNIWGNINASCILCGARTLNGCLVPLVGPIPKNNRFSDADYNRATGLVGNKSNKNIDTNFNNNTTAMNDIHIAVYVQQAQTTSGAYCGLSVSPGNLHVIYQGNPPQARCRNNTLGNLPTGISPLGLVGVSRSSSGSFIGRSSQTQLTITSASDAGSPGAGNFFIFDRGDINLPSDGRYQFYSIGTSINLELLDNRVTALINELSGARSL
jgi:hypothetical protein